MTRVGEKLREFRTRRGWSTRRLAKELGLSHPMISQYERGLSKIDADFLPRMADVLGVQPAAFYGEEERPVSVAEAIRIMDAYVRSQDSHPSAPSGYPTATASHPTPNGGHPGHDRMLPEAEWRKPFWTIVQAASPALATR